MLGINGFLQRDRLHELLRRWILNQPLPTDAAAILELVHFNNVVVARYLSRFSEQLFRELHHCDLVREQALTKGDLKDRIAGTLPYHAPRFDELLKDYASDPGRYFRETPFHGTLYFRVRGNQRYYLGSSRIKRIRRLAEKSARRLVDWSVAGRQPAAASRGEPPAVSDTAGSSPDRTMVDESAVLARAEAAFLARLRSGECPHLPANLAINDVAGVKVVLDSSDAAPLLAALQQLDCRVLEQERHTGRYSATNLVVEYRPDKAHLLAQPLGAQILRVFAGHGIGAGQASRRFTEFIAGSEASVKLEIIVSSYAEMLESEIGNCMHEERIIRQRRNPLYLGQLAQNAEFLLEYLFTLPASNLREIECLPVRLWDRYLPDYFDEVRRRMFSIPSVELNGT